MSGLNEFGELVLDSERTVPELKVSPSLFIDKNIHKL